MFYQNQNLLNNPRRYRSKFKNSSVPKYSNGDQFKTTQNPGFRRFNDHSFGTSEQFREYTGRFHDDRGMFHENSGRFYDNRGMFHENSGRFHGDDGRFHEDFGRFHEDAGRSHEAAGRFLYTGSYESLATRLKKNFKFKKMICFGNMLWDFCRETSMHGFNHIASQDRHPFERLVWVLATVLAIWGTVSISLGQWKRYNESPTVVTLEKDFRNWRYTFPALTLCSSNRVDPGRATVAIKNLWNVEKTDERYERYLQFVNVVANSELTKLEGFQDYVGQKDLDVDLYQLAVDVMPEFSVKQAWVDGLDPSWLPVMTEFGACHTVNSLAIPDIVIAPLEKPDPTSYPIECKYSAHTCYVTLEINYCIKIYTHSAYDIADATLVGLELCPATQRKLELTVVESGCGPGVRQLAVSRRGCLYTDEPPANLTFQVYSMSLCRRSCRNRLAIKLCGCTPFFNFYEEGKRCDISGMACLAQYSNELRTFSKSSAGANERRNRNAEPEVLLECSCSPQCEDAVYQESSREDQSWMKGPFATRGSARYSVQAPRTRYSREIVFYFQDLVVSFGGAAGLFLGASFLSFVEVLYFLLERMFRPCKRLRPRKPDVGPEDITTVHVVGSSEHSRLQELDTLLQTGQLRPQVHSQRWELTDQPSLQTWK